MITLSGEIHKVLNEEEYYCKKKFYHFFPESKRYADFHGFNFYKLNINNIRWIGGFGKISWLSLENWKPQKPKWEEHEEDIINHMNKDHQNSIWCMRIDCGYIL